MIGDAVFFNQRDKIVLGVALQGRNTEPGIVRQKIGRGSMQIGKVRSPAAGNANFLCNLVSLIQHQNPAAASGCFGGTHKARRPAANYDHIMGLHGVGIADASPVAKPGILGQSA